MHHTSQQHQIKLAPPTVPSAETLTWFQTHNAILLERLEMQKKGETSISVALSPSTSGSSFSSFSSPVATTTIPIPDQLPFLFPFLNEIKIPSSPKVISSNKNNNNSNISQKKTTTTPLATTPEKFLHKNRFIHPEQVLELLISIKDPKLTMMNRMTLLFDTCCAILTEKSFGSSFSSNNSNNINIKNKNVLAQCIVGSGAKIDTKQEQMIADTVLRCSLTFRTAAATICGGSKKQEISDNAAKLFEASQRVSDLLLGNEICSPTSGSNNKNSVSEDSSPCYSNTATSPACAAAAANAGTRPQQEQQEDAHHQAAATSKAVTSSAAQQQQQKTEKTEKKNIETIDVEKFMSNVSNRVIQSKLSRFVKAQNGGQGGISRDTALRELKMGQKKSCFIWYIFMQLLDPARSSINNSTYQLHGQTECVAFLLHQELCSRQVEHFSVVLHGLEVKNIEPQKLLGGGVDAKKLHHSASSFYFASDSLIKEDEKYGGQISKAFLNPIIWKNVLQIHQLTAAVIKSILRTPYSIMPKELSKEGHDPVMITQWEKSVDWRNLGPTK